MLTFILINRNVINLWGPGSEHEPREVSFMHGLGTWYGPAGTERSKTGNIMNMDIKVIRTWHEIYAYWFVRVGGGGESYSVDHLNGTGLPCAPSTGIVHHQPAMYTMVHKGDLCAWEVRVIFHFWWFTWNMHKTRHFLSIVWCSRALFQGS